MKILSVGGVNSKHWHMCLKKIWNHHPWRIPVLSLARSLTNWYALGMNLHLIVTRGLVQTEFFYETSIFLHKDTPTSYKFTFLCYLILIYILTKSLPNSKQNMKLLTSLSGLGHTMYSITPSFSKVSKTVVFWGGGVGFFWLLFYKIRQNEFCCLKD